MPTTKRPEPVDLYVGERIRMRRLQLGMSQEALGKDLGLSFQQVQKYETGKNRVSASRLQMIAGVLKVPLIWLFQAAPGSIPTNGDDAANRAYTKFIGQQGGMALMTHWQALTPAERLGVAQMVEALANGKKDRRPSRGD